MRVLLLFLLLSSVRPLESWSPEEWPGAQEYIPGVQREFVTASSLLAPGIWVYDSVREQDKALHLPYVSSWVYFDVVDEMLERTTFTFQSGCYLAYRTLEENVLMEAYGPYYFRHGPNYTEYLNGTLHLTVFWPSHPEAHRELEIGRRVPITPSLSQLLYYFQVQKEDGPVLLPSEPLL